MQTRRVRSECASGTPSSLFFRPRIAPKETASSLFERQFLTSFASVLSPTTSAGSVEYKEYAHSQRLQLQVTVKEQREEQEQSASHQSWAA
jgi:hypothetical protein